MDTKKYLEDLNAHISHLYSFAIQINELDFAMSLSGEARGAQAPGWSTTITAHEVFDEITALLSKPAPYSRSEIRLMLMLYCQLAEAGGFYETLRNIINLITLKPYVFWPFQNLVRVKQSPKRIIGPNANATFRDLASAAKEVGLARLSSLLEETFRDDIRNGIAHADYVIWDDGLRLRKRNGGYAKLLTYTDINAALARGINFFHILYSHNVSAVRRYHPSIEIVGRLSLNPPMPWTVSLDPVVGSLSISSSSPGPQMTGELKRQDAINGLLGGKVFALYVSAEDEFSQRVESHITAKGFEPAVAVLSGEQLTALGSRISDENLWDERQMRDGTSNVLLVSPWGCRRMLDHTDFDGILGRPMVELEIA